MEFDGLLIFCMEFSILEHALDNSFFFFSNAFNWEFARFGTEASVFYLTFLLLGLIYVIPAKLNKKNTFFFKITIFFSQNKYTMRRVIHIESKQFCIRKLDMSEREK